MRFMLQRERSDEGAILRDGLYLGLLHKGGEVSEYGCGTSFELSGNLWPLPASVLS